MFNVPDGVYAVADDRQLSVLISLDDLPATFDTVDHSDAADRASEVRVRIDRHASSGLSAFLLRRPWR